jgi:Retron-type reverse transcriptase
MIRDNHLLERVADPENLRLASWKAARGKRYSAAVLTFQSNLDRNLLQLRKQILSGYVEVGDYHYFKVYEPKERQICASAFREQVLHHALMNICHPRFERAQVADSYASRKGKGTFAALDRARHFTHSNPWFLKLDVKKFFESIHHNVLKAQLARLFREEKLLGIFCQIIDSYAASPERGLPIGNLTSQYFANHYLSGLDHYAKERLGIRAYVRYMDDMVLWHSDPAPLKVARKAIIEYVRTQLHCDLKPTLLNRSQRGLPFLGYRVFPYQVRLLHKSKHRYIRKTRSVYEHYHSGDWTERACQVRAAGLVAFTYHADALGFRKAVLSRLQGQVP